jgi:uroporphyrinogen decarboxylase
MNSRERVLKAFKRLPGLPDRVPVQFDLFRQLADHFGKVMGIPVHYTDNPYEDVTYRISANDLRLAMGSDVVVTGASVSDDFKIVMDEQGCRLNEYGMKMRQGDIYVEVIEYPLAHAETRADIEAFRFPDPNAPGRFRDAEALVKKYKNDYLIFGDIEVTVFSLAHQLVGMEKLRVDMMMETEYVVPLFEACAEYQTQIGLRLIERGVDAIWFGDDFGTQVSLIIAPETFRAQLKPHYTRMIDRFKEAKPDIIPILHCDGAVADLLGDIREIGFEVFNPVQPGVPGHLPLDMKKNFGNQFVFWGAIDQQDLLPHGTDEELERDIMEKISILRFMSFKL